MNRNKLKTYAPQARRDFIQAVTDRATQYGLTAKKIEPMTEQGEVVLILGQPFPKSVGVKRKKLEARIQKLGFEQTMEAMAYTWFNRLVAIRFMELHGYLEHGFRVLSHPDGHSQPEILEHAQHVDLPGLDQKKVVELKLDGTKEEELYRLLLIAQCKALHKALPFLFESIDDETELLLSDNLLHSDSLIRKLLNEIPEEDWLEEVQIVGWLYQFYISEKKDEVIGKVVASEDIPAATQLFTPNWIVKYLVQNTLGRQWMATYSQSPLKGQMEYYIEPSEQTPEVQEQLKAITPTSLNPEELTLLDPACGSGHILVEAYDLFKAIYQERGYRAKDIPTLILKKNLFGLEIDDRAAQLAAFALMMKARADDRRIFDSGAKPNILAFEDSQGMNVADITHALNSPILKEPMPPKEMLFDEIEEETAGLFSKRSLAEKGHVSQGDIASLLELFEKSKTFGSLIQVPQKLASKIPDIEQRLNAVLKHGDLTHAPAHVIMPLLQQAQFLARRYDAVVANPPYMGNRAMNPVVKAFGQKRYPEAKNDLFAMFTVRLGELGSENSHVGVMTPFTWMFLTSFTGLRDFILSKKGITSLIRPEYHSFFDSAYVPICTFVFRNTHLVMNSTFIDLAQFYGEDQQSLRAKEAIQEPTCSWRHSIDVSAFDAIPDRLFAYWASESVLAHFRTQPPVDSLASPKQGLSTCNNDLFLRYWHESDTARICFNARTRNEAVQSHAKWFPYNKGGAFRRWYGNHEYIVDWENDGASIHAYNNVPLDYAGAPMRGKQYYFREGMTWTALTIGEFSGRYSPPGFIFDAKGPVLFPVSDVPLLVLLGLFNSVVASAFLKILAPTMDFNQGPVGRVPFAVPTNRYPEIEECVRSLIELAKTDWNLSELSWEFQRNPLCGNSKATLQDSFHEFVTDCSKRFGEVRECELINNRLFVEVYGLQDELVPGVPDNQITLYRPCQEEDLKRLASYSVGLMMGRYSLDNPGLIYAHSGNQRFDPGQYTTFSADEDGILPITEFNWFPDDAAVRFERFIGTAWPAENLEANLKFVAESLGAKKGESPRETIRRYLAAEFFKHHLSMYKRRPIYWLFSSGKQRGFQALVYLHRYNDGTLARMRTEYVIPLIGKMTARIDNLADDIAAASASQHRKRLETEKVTITKQLAEVQAFEEKLRHYADQRIKLDLDDGVKVNYGKFSDPEIGNILAEVKAVCGTKDEE